MRFVTVSDAAKILSAFEAANGRRSVSPRRVRYFLDIGRLSGIRMSLDDPTRTRARGRRSEILVQIPSAVLQFQSASAA